VNKPKILVDDAVVAVRSYQGEPYHALLADPPYHLDTISKRFGKSDSAPARYGTDGAFQRASKGFMGQSWDSDVAFRPETWDAFKAVLYPGAFGMAFAGARTYHHMACAIEEAGFIIHPMIGWVYSSGMPKATKIRVDDLVWDGYKYGLGVQKPALEPICVFQRPYEGRPIENIVKTGAGVFNIEGGRVKSDAPYVINRFDDGAKPFGGGAGHEYTTTMETKGRWPANFIGGDLPPYFYQPKPNAKERDAGLDGKNPHAAIKPIDLNRYLATLLLPPEMYAPRRLLNPFAGTGSEAIGAALAGWEQVDAIEIDPAYAETALLRINHWIPDM
jgi:site-specific DNA-methyltransferase (adenine-specific)